MSIESKIPTEELSIKDLQLEKPEMEQLDYFDADKEITPEKWKQFEDARQDFIQAGDEPNYVYMTADMMLLAPAKRITVDPVFKEHLNDKVESDLWKHFYDLGRGLILPHKANFAYTLTDQYRKIICKDEANLVMCEDADKAALRDLIDECQKTRNFRCYIKVAVAAKLLFPEEFADFQFDQEIIDDYANELSGPIDIDTASDAINSLPFLKLCSPDFKLSPKQLGKLKEFLRGSNPDYYVPLASALKFATAKEVLVTDKEIKLVMPEAQQDLRKPAAVLPEVKKF